MTTDAECLHPLSPPAGWETASFTFDCPQCGELCFHESDGTTRLFAIALPDGRQVRPTGYVELPED